MGRLHPLQGSWREDGGHPVFLVRCVDVARLIAFWQLVESIEELHVDANPDRLDHILDWYQCLVATKI